MLRKLIDQEYRRDALFLAVLVGLFCLRFYNRQFIFQGDVALNLYLHGNPELFSGGWDPYGCYYLGWYPVFGFMFPLNFLMHMAVHAVHGDPWSVLVLLQVNAALSLFLLAYFTYLFLRDLGVGRCGALLGGVLMTSTGFHIETSMLELDLFYLHSFMFVPLVLLFMAKAFREERPVWLGGAGFCLGLSLLGGGNVPMFMFVPILPLTLLLARPLAELRGWRPWLRALLATALVGLVGVVVGAAMVLPSAVNMQYSARAFFVGSQILSEEFTMPFAWTVTTMLFRDWWLANTNLANGFHELDSFLGVVALLFAAVGLGVGFVRRQGVFLFMVVLAGYAVLLMHAPALPRLLSLPAEFYLELASIRFPYRFFMVLLLPVAYFVGRGLEAILAGQAGRTEKVVVALLAPPLLLAYAYQAWCYYDRTMIYQAQAGFLVAHLILLLLLGTIGAVRYLPRGASWGRLFWLSQGLIAGVFLFYLFLRPPIPASADYQERDVTKSEAWKSDFHENVAESLARHYGDPPRIWRAIKESDPSLYRIYQRHLMRRGNLWAPHDHAEIAFDPGIDPASSRYLYRLQEEMKDFEQSPLLDLLNVKYVYFPKYEGSKLLPTTTPGIFRNPDVLERYFVVHGVDYFADHEEVLQTMVAGGFPSTVYKEKVFLVQPEKAGTSSPAPATGKSDAVRIVLREPTHIVLEVESSAPGVVVALEPWMPLWKAFLDGREVELLLADSAFWGVAIPVGLHRVEFRFEDRAATIGRLVTGLALVFGMVGGLLIYRKSKNRDCDFGAPPRRAGSETI